MASNAVFTQEVTYISTACPSWCDKGFLHECTEHYSADRVSRYHTGPAWGRFKVYGEEFTHSPGDIIAAVSLELPNDVLDGLDAPALRQMALDALAAAAWMEAHQ